MQKRLFNGYFDGNTNCVSIYDSHYISLLKLGHNSAHLHIDLFNIINVSIIQNIKIKNII